jgi:hypothetical protein
MRTHSGHAAEASGATDVIEVIEMIEMIEVDDEAFGQPHATAPRMPAHRQPPRWQVLALVGALLAVAVVVVLQPWRSPATWRTFSVPLSPATLPDHQVLAAPAAPLVSVLEGSDLTDEEVLADGVGHVFAAGGATATRGQWAWFRVEGVSPELTAALPTSPTAADVEDLGSRRLQLVWSPQPGQRWTVETHELTTDATSTFAAAVGVHDGHAALRSGYSLQGLQPVAGIAGMVIAQRLLDGLVQGAPSPAATVVRYRSVTTPTSVATTRSPDDAAAAVQFLLGGIEASVHDRPATAATTATLGTVVAWVEGGRLVVATGPLTPADQVAAADGVRTATSDDPVEFEPAGEVTAVVGQGATADGRVWEASVQFGLATDVCVVIDNLDSRPYCVTTLHATMATMSYITTPLGIVVVALSNAPDPGLVQLTTLDGGSTLLRMRPLVWNLSATAFQPLPGQSYELLPATTFGATPTDGRLRPEVVVETGDGPTAYLLDSPLVTPYSAGIPTPLDERGHFQMWRDEEGWLTAQASPLRPDPVAFDAERRVVDRVEVVSPLADPLTSTVTVPMEDGWWLTLRANGLTDEELVARIGEFRMVDGGVLARNVATTNRPADLSTRWGSEALFGAVFARSGYLTPEGELITLHVGQQVAGQAAWRQVFPLFATSWSDDLGPSPVGGLLLGGTLADSGEQIMTWTEGDQIISLTGRVSPRTLLALLSSVRPAQGSEWTDQIDRLRPSYRLGDFATVAVNDEWRAGVQLATRNGAPRYLWWWSAPGDVSSTASLAMRDNPALEPMVDTIVVPDATYVFVTVPNAGDGATEPVLEARQGDLVVPLELVRPFPDLGFRIAIVRFDTPGPISVWLAGEELLP